MNPIAVISIDAMYHARRYGSSAVVTPVQFHIFLHHPANPRDHCSCHRQCITVIEGRMIGACAGVTTAYESVLIRFSSNLP